MIESSSQDFTMSRVVCGDPMLDPWTIEVVPHIEYLTDGGRSKTAGPIARISEVNVYRYNTTEPTLNLTEDEAVCMISGLIRALVLAQAITTEQRQLLRKELQEDET